VTARAPAPAPARILVVGREDDERVREGVAWLRETWTLDVDLAELSGGSAWPERLWTWRGDHLVSYRCPAIVPADVLARASGTALNFHVGPPEYRGVGSVNFALYDNAAQFGVTCHHMTARLDAGPIVAVRRFPIAPADTVATVLPQAYAHLQALFYDVMGTLRDGGALPASDEAWSGALRTRAELNALATVRADMDPAEVARRARACRYGTFDLTRVS